MGGGVGNGVAAPSDTCQRGGTIESYQNMLYKRNKINSVLATIYFISATDFRTCGTNLLKCFRNALAYLAYFWGLGIMQQFI